MGWNSTANSIPPQSGSYLVTVNIDNYYFRYIARYEEESNRFYKIDEFSPGNNSGEDITDRITGWHEDTIGVFLG